MSHVCLQFGQCGNQLGHEFFSAINNDLDATGTGVSVKQNASYCMISKEKWFREREKSDKLTARAVLVDTESKVIKNINRLMKSNSVWEYSKINCVAESSGGAANNWALGYRVKGPIIHDKVIELVRKECERCDRLQSVLCFSSSAGGTGSGVGSYLTEQLRDELPDKFLMNVVVLPFKSGEVVTQNYNTLFSLSKWYDKSDGIFLIENDSIHKLSSYDMKIKHVSYSNINNLIAQQIASIFQPIASSGNITDSILDLVSHESLKLLSIKTAPHVPFLSSPFDSMPKWDTLIKTIEKSLRVPYQAPFNKLKSKIDANYKTTYVKSIGNVVIFRGLDAPSAAISSEDGKVFDRNSWMCKLPEYVYLCENRRFFNKDRFITLVTNNSSVTTILNDIIGKSWNTFIHNAYIHQYLKYGIENEEILEMFFKMETVLKNYKSL